MLYGFSFTFVFLINFHGGSNPRTPTTTKLHMFQGLIGLEGDELAQFIPSAGQKYAFFFLDVCVSVVFVFL